MGCDYCGSDFKDSLMPFKCRRCGGSFCNDHRLPENHECVGLENVNKVPLNETKVSFKDIFGECKKCGEKVYLPFECKYCGYKYCGKHRLPENHGCVGLKNVNKVPSKETKELFKDFYGECKKCGEKVYLPFECKYCGYKYCGKHHLPENHGCVGLGDNKSSEPDITEPDIIDGETEEGGSATTKYPFNSVGFISSILFVLGAVFVIGDYHLLALMPMIFLMCQYISIFIK